MCSIALNEIKVHDDKHDEGNSETCNTMAIMMRKATMPLLPMTMMVIMTMKMMSMLKLIDNNDGAYNNDDIEDT